MELANNFEIDRNALVFSPMRNPVLALGLGVIEEEYKVLGGFLAKGDSHYISSSKEGLFRVRLG